MHAVSLPTAPARAEALLLDLVRLAAVAAAYYVTGKLGLLLAIPPGYATAVWPPAGIALAAVLLWGRRMLPSIWLGSFLVNISTPLGNSSVADLIAEAQVPAAVACGAVLQAWLGQTLIERFVGYRNLLTQEVDGVRLLALGGPVSCVVNATIGVTALYLHGDVSGENFRFSWFTWWVGDSIGVMLFAALVLIWSLRPAAGWRRRQIRASLPLAGMFALVVAIFTYTSYREEAGIRREFTAWVDAFTNQVQRDGISAGTLREQAADLERRGVLVGIDLAGAGGAPIYMSVAWPANRTGDLRIERKLAVAGQYWILRFVLPAGYLVAHRSLEAWNILAGGALATSLLGMFLLLITGRTARVEELVAAQTLELRSANAALAAASQHSAALEQQAQQRAAQLATSNAELERFAYVASHDLRAPLRSIGGFAQLLRRHYGERIEPEAADFLNAIRDGTKEMQALVDALLELSTLNAATLELAAVPLGEVLARARQQLAQDIAESGAVVEAAGLPVVRGDPRLLLHLFQNLIGNALKFRAAGVLPRLTIGAVRENGNWHLSFEDNGIGIPADRLDQIFQMFKRLHSQDRYPGAGMGLAICRRAVELHGGRIYASCAPGQGAVFHVLLPAC